MRNKGLILVISTVLSLVISFVCYIMNNCPYPYWDSLNRYCWLEYMIRRIFPEKMDRSDVMFINVSYDREVVDYTYSGKTLTGTIDITNRKTLLDFLEIAEKTNAYKYIFLDLRFEEGINTPYDSALFAQIGKMRDISFSKHSDLTTNEFAVKNKATINDYFTTITGTNFTRYQYIQNGEESVPLRMYNEINGLDKSIEGEGLFYTSNGELCYNSPFMRIPEDFYEGHEERGNLNYFDLGPMLLKMYNEEDWEESTKDRILIVGDFVNDLHDTYVGMQPGSYLVYLAYKALANGRHKLSWPFMTIMFFVYIVIAYFIIVRKNLISYIPRVRRIRNKAALFLIDMLGYSTLLTLISITMYAIFRSTYNIFFPSLVFSILSTVISLKYKKR